MKRTTINDVARVANVSKTTVSHFLNSRFSYMGEETRRRIAEAVDELNYNPNFVAKSMTSKRTMTIGIIVANILHNFSTQIIRAVEDCAHDAGYQVIVCNADDDADKEKGYVSMLLAKQIDGIIAIPTSGNEVLFRKLHQENFPVIFVDRYIDDVDVPSYLLDNHHAIETAFDYFVDRNFKDIGFVSQELFNITPRKERRNAYLSLCEEEDVSPFTISASLNNIKEALSHAIYEDTLPRALIVANDLALLEVLREVKQHDIDIPDDLSIISIDDIEFTEFFNPSLTVIAQPAFDIGRRAAEALFTHIDNEEEPEKIINRFEPRLIERSSVKNDWYQ